MPKQETDAFEDCLHKLAFAVDYFLEMHDSEGGGPGPGTPPWLDAIDLLQVRLTEYSALTDIPPEIH